MALINEHYLELTAGYLFPEIGRRVQAFQKAKPDSGNPKAEIIRLGIGDVVLPLAPSIVKAFEEGVKEMGETSTFRGYGPEQGYPFLIEDIIKHEFQPRGVSLKPSEVFVSDGSKCDTGNIQEIFAVSNRIAVTDPVYPVYVDTNIMAGRGAKMLYLSATPENGFSPSLPKGAVDLIYLCSPNNPTGAALRREALERWVAYARKNRAIILFDAAYESFITESDLPHSIFETPGAREVAIEFRSFSKKAGFTGTRCAFTVVPHELKGYDAKGKEVLINPLWHRRQTTKFNGVSYPVQRAAAACYTPEGKREIQGQIDYYMTNARLIREGLQEAGFEVYGGVNAPYIWAKTPKGLDSWGTFDKILKEAYVVVTPGSGFGPSGEGFFRLSAFGIRGEIEEAMRRIQKM